MSSIAQMKLTLDIEHLISEYEKWEGAIYNEIKSLESFEETGDLGVIPEIRRRLENFKLHLQLRRRDAIKSLNAMEEFYASREGS